VGVKLTSKKGVSPTSAKKYDQVLPHESSPLLPDSPSSPKRLKRGFTNTMRAPERRPSRHESMIMYKIDQRKKAFERTQENRAALKRALTAVNNARSKLGDELKPVIKLSENNNDEPLRRFIDKKSATSPLNPNKDLLLTDDEIKQAFDQFDLDGNGKIDQ
jgi:hypothetical protein